MIITTATVEDYKRVRKVAITPAADAHLVLLGGKNMQGKSSTLDALTAAFGGAKAVAADPVRRGAKEATIVVTLKDDEGGTTTITRTIAPDGKTTLDVRNEDGPIRSPQAMLDKIVANRFLDPLQFMRLPAKEQRARLMQVIPDAARIDTLDVKKAGAFDRRTEIGRALKSAEGELARLPEVADAGQEIDVAALSAEQTTLLDEQRKEFVVRSAVDEQVRALRDAEQGAERTRRELAEIDAQIVALQGKLDRARTAVATDEARIAAAKADLAAAEAKVGDNVPRGTAVIARLEAIRAELARAADHNREVHTRQAQVARRAETLAAVEKLKGDAEACTKTLATIEQRKAEVLAAAKLPVEGLTIGDDAILLGGVPFAQASGAEQLRVALAIAASASPNLRDVWVKDAAILDDEQLGVIGAWAESTGRRVWLERIGTRDPGVIEIRDGEVAP